MALHAPVHPTSRGGSGGHSSAKIVHLMMPSIANDRAEVAVGISPPTRASVANDRAEVAVGIPPQRSCI
jgi:hypothetical protein